MTTIQPSTLAQQQGIYNLINGSNPEALPGASGAATDGSDSPPVYLTPEALMIYCQTRLQGIDSQVQAAMTQQQNVNWEQTSIQGFLQELSTDSTKAGSGVMYDTTECQTLEQNLENSDRADPAARPGMRAARAARAASRRHHGHRDGCLDLQRRLPRLLLQQWDRGPGRGAYRADATRERPLRR